MNKQDEKYSKSLPNFSQSGIELLVKKKQKKYSKSKQCILIDLISIYRIKFIKIGIQIICKYPYYFC